MSLFRNSVPVSLNNPHDVLVMKDLLLSTEEIVLMKAVDSMFCALTRVMENMNSGPPV